MKKTSPEYEKLRSIVKEEVLREMEEQQKAKSMHDTIVDIAKAAAAGQKAVETLKSKAMPTEKSAQAVSAAVTALEHIFNDMVTNPTRYLDHDPAAVVQKHVKSLDDREASLRDAMESSGEPTLG